VSSRLSYLLERLRKTHNVRYAFRWSLHSRDHLGCSANTIKGLLILLLGDDLYAQILLAQLLVETFNVLFLGVDNLVERLDLLIEMLFLNSCEVLVGGLHQPDLTVTIL
jgi:hypothetical protein